MTDDNYPDKEVTGMKVDVEATRIKYIHAGRIHFNDKELLDNLGFSGGRIHYIGRSEVQLGMVMLITHPSLPLIRECDPVPEVYLPVFRLVPETDYILHGGMVRRIKESIRAFMYVWKGYRRVRK